MKLIVKRMRRVVDRMDEVKKARRNDRWFFEEENLAVPPVGADLQTIWSELNSVAEEDEPCLINVWPGSVVH